MGWDEYFVQEGHPRYLPGAGRTCPFGFNQAVFIDVRAGILPPGSQPAIPRASNESHWPIFRFGTSPGVPNPDEQFPVEAIDQFSKQGIPDPTRTFRNPNPTYKAPSDLAVQVKGAVPMTHSDGKHYNFGP